MHTYTYTYTYHMHIYMNTYRCICKRTYMYTCTCVYIHGDVSQKANRASSENYGKGVKARRIYNIPQPLTRALSAHQQYCNVILLGKGCTSKIACVLC